MAGAPHSPSDRPRPRGERATQLSSLASSDLRSEPNFPAAVHPRDPNILFLVPLNGDTAGRFMPGADVFIPTAISGA